MADFFLFFFGRECGLSFLSFLQLIIFEVSLLKLFQFNVILFKRQTCTKYFTPVNWHATNAWLLLIYYFIFCISQEKSEMCGMHILILYKRGTLLAKTQTNCGVSVNIKCPLICSVIYRSGTLTGPF